MNGPIVHWARIALLLSLITASTVATIWEMAARLTHRRAPFAIEVISFLVFIAGAAILLKYALEGKSRRSTGGQMTPQDYLKSCGWTSDGMGGMLDPSGDRRVDFGEYFGLVWELQRFDDSDCDGVATARWKRATEGDSLGDLVDAMGGKA